MKLIILFLFIFCSHAVVAGECSGDSHWVRAYHRRAYYRGDGTFVAATAVNVDTYLFNPDLLKKKVPHAYTWIKEHFSDKFVIRKGGKK